MQGVQADDAAWLLAFTQFDAFLACLAAVAAVSLLCRAGKMLARWALIAAALLLGLNLAVGVLSGRGSWATTARVQLNDAQRWFSGVRLYESVASSRSLASARAVSRDWLADAPDPAEPAEPAKPAPVTAPTAPVPADTGAGGGWAYPWA